MASQQQRETHIPEEETPPPYREQVSPKVNKGVSHSQLIPCPQCGIYNYRQKIRYLNPQTGEQTKISKLDIVVSSCLLMFVGYIVGGFIIVFAIAGLLALAGHLNDPLYADYGMMAIPFAFIFAFVTPAVAIPPYLKSREKGLSKTHITVSHYLCWNCKYEWTITQKPPAKQSSLVSF